MHDTKRELIRAGAELFLRRSFQGTGINDILKTAGVPKGSFYHFFPGKEEFALAVVAYQAEMTSARWAAVLENSDLPPLGRVRALFDASMERLASADCAVGCPLGTMAQEMAGLSESLRRATDEGMRRIEAQLAACLREGQERGDISRGLDAEGAARFIWYAWQGALIAVKAAGSTAPMRDLKTMVTERFLPAPPAPERA